MGASIEVGDAGVDGLTVEAGVSVADGLVVGDVAVEDKGAPKSIAG
jgi:hypothetical protein